MIHLVWDSGVALSDWTEAHTIEWRKFAAIIPETVKTLQLSDVPFESKMWCWTTPTETEDRAPEVRSVFKLRAEDESAALVVIKTTLLQIVELFGAPQVPRPEPESNADGSD
ncbi:hypothetical protein CH293_20265 [Rhodococcus sp. 14-2470-1b]|nr:hypothetical protein CH293_20265 [Rhodococcus sp. 14-2470-1b]